MPKQLNRRTLLLMCGSLAALSGCAGSAARRQKRLAQGTADNLYKQGRKSLDSRDYAQAIRVYEALVARYPFANEARQARLDLIYAYYRAGETESATDAADTFIRENPTHPRIDYAWYLKGLIDFGKTPNIVEKWLRVDFDQRAPNTALSAFEAFRIVVERFPKSAYAHDARQRMIYLRNRLAGYEMQVANYYASRGAWVASAQRAKQVVEQYDGAPAVKDALRMLSRSYRELGYDDLAGNVERVFEENFPGEPLRITVRKSHWWTFGR